jgi:hypothetical protein
MSPAGFESTNSEGEQPQTYTAAAGMTVSYITEIKPDKIQFIR